MIFSTNLDTDENITYNDTASENHTYTYDSDWSDLLISYDGQTITYDTAGNPTTYRGNTLTWSNGRQLASFGAYTYTYNYDGIRTSKTVDGNTTNFYLDGSSIIEQTDGANILHFYCDRSGDVIGFELNGKDYVYLKNLQGDVTAISDLGGNIAAQYTYDDWGKVTSTTGSDLTVANANPIRYRSYYYDTETGLYYLQSRYYDPETGRFLNCDDGRYIGVSGTVLGWNPFAYCENEPVNCVDPFGTKSINITNKLINLMRINAAELARVYADYRENNIKTVAYFKTVKYFVSKVRTGPGLYQIYSRTSHWKYISSYFDDPRDSAMISIGLDLYDLGIALRLYRMMQIISKVGGLF